MDEFQKQMLAFMGEAKEKQKEADERREKEESKRLEERIEVTKRLDGLVAEIAMSVKAGIKKEVQDAVEPLKNRQDQTEKETEAAKDKINKLEEEVKEMRKDMVMLKEKKTETWASKLAEGGGRSLPGGWTARSKGSHTEECPSTKDARGMDDKDAKVRKIIREAKKIVGMKPIDKAHVEQTMRRNDDTDKDMDKDERWKKAMDETVKAFLKYEMKMKQEDIEELKINKIYPPAKDEWNILYVELETIEMVNFLMSFTQYMRRDRKEDKPSIEKYIPKELFARYSAIEKLAFEIRKQSNFKTATNVNFGETDLVLKTRSKDIQPGGTRVPWRQIDPVTLPEDLPNFEMRLASAAPRTLRSPTQAPGRPALTPEKRDKRKERGTPGSPTSPEAKQIKKASSLNDHPAGSSTPVSPALKLKQISPVSDTVSPNSTSSVKA